MEPKRKGMGKDIKLERDLRQWKENMQRIKEHVKR